MMYTMIVICSVYALFCVLVLIYHIREEKTNTQELRSRIQLLEENSTSFLSGDLPDKNVLHTSAIIGTIGRGQHINIRHDGRYLWVEAGFEDEDEVFK